MKLLRIVFLLPLLVACLQVSGPEQPRHSDLPIVPTDPGDEVSLIASLQVTPTVPGSQTGLVSLVASNFLNDVLIVRIYWDLEGSSDCDVYETNTPLYLLHDYEDCGTYTVRVEVEDPGESPPVTDFEDRELVLCSAEDPPPPPEVPEGCVLIDAGSFVMGSPEDEPGHDSWGDETQHTVTLTTAFYMSTTEVTNEQYREMAQWAYDNGYCTASSSSLQDALDGSTQELLDLNDSDCEIDFAGGVFTCENPDHPVMEVTWYGSVAYCDWKSLREGLPRAYDHSTWQCNSHQPYSAEGYRLPTEAEWEYACRSGSTTAFANGEITDTGCNDPVLDEIGWYCGNAGGWTHPVAEKIPNAWGLYDMHGNLYEWCNDWYASYGGDVTDPVGPATGSDRLLRGGFWYDLALDCRSAGRRNLNPSISFSSIGFRFMRSAF
jgi:formylglycine-generating enzyme required for sulfatase activity